MDENNQPKKARHSIAVPDANSGRRKMSFLNLNIPDTNWRGSLTHLHLPSFTLTAPDGEQKGRFNFSLGLRRHSHNTLHHSESMLSLCFRSLETYINDDNLQGLLSFLENKQVQIEDKDENGTTALILAASKGRTGFVRELLRYGADPNTEDNDNWTALLCACKGGYVDIVLLLLDSRADIEHRDMGGWTPLMWATYKGRTEIVHILLERGAEVNAHGNYHISSLLWAAGRGYVDIARMLIDKGAKINVGDKYGTTALVWACRKGHSEIVDLLLSAGSNVDTAGMYSWTPLLVATQGNYADVVTSLLDHRPNVNALDKDGCSALTIACKEGYYEIATALMSAGAYINVQDRSGDTNLIHAVKGGHRGVVEALLKKYADVDIAGKDHKTAIYIAVEKGNYNITKILLGANPDLEIATKDGDTALLKAVRSRNADIVQILLEKKAKVSAADKKGDTALHIAMRARSKAIVEILLRNPKHSQLLYRPNRSGETPYNIDINHQKTILGQIFGARRLNTNEDNENMLGYDLYSSALADILSEPSLSMPITVGLYAKWGSGKSFLLSKLRDEMKNFAREWVDPVFQFTTLIFILITHISLIIGIVVFLSASSWRYGLFVGLSVLILSYVFLGLIWFASKSYDWDWPYAFSVKLTRKLNNLKLILQILFCHPPGASSQEILSTAQPIRFYFTDQTRVSSTAGGENSIVQMIGSLYDAIESDCGSFVTRLYRAFRPKSVKSSSSWKWRKMCCIPYVALFEITFLCLLIGICALTIYLIHINVNAPSSEDNVTKVTLEVTLISSGLLLFVVTIANSYTWSRMLRSVFFSQRRHLRRSISKLDTLKSEGFLQALRQEVNLMKDMVKCLDSLSQQQTRLVIVVDGLDSCEQEKVLLILDTVHMLFSDNNSPFIVILAIDPHVIAKAVEMNTRRLFNENNIGGHSYLSNMVHLPFYLQNSGLRKVKVAQQTAQQHRKSTVAGWNDNEENLNNFLARSSSSRRLSNESGLMSSTEKLKYTSRKGSRKLKLSESVASSIGSNLNKIGGAQDLTKMLLTDDYFSDVNPRSMRRLMNVVYVTGRLLKAFQIDFNWYRLASWINITEQWPFRTSWILYHCELYEESSDENTPLKSIYDKIRSHINAVKDSEPLLELDRDEKKFDIFLTFHRSSLLLSDLKVFLPFTINLDPYLKKVIKEEIQCIEDEGLIMNRSLKLGLPQVPGLSNVTWPSMDAEWTPHKAVINRRARVTTKTPTANSLLYPQSAMVGWSQQGWSGQYPISLNPPISITAAPHISPEVLESRLISLNVEGVCKLLQKIEDLSPPALTAYTKIIKSNNINGRVLLNCDLEELKKLLNMSFGDWEMFKAIIYTLREHEMNAMLKQEETKHFRVTKPVERKGSLTKAGTSADKESNKSTVDAPQRKQSVIEKQVTLEDQMICGALQTLNEEACEDVLDETEDTRITIDSDVPVTVIPPSPESNQDYQESRSRTNSATGETDYVILQSSPVGHMHWQPITISINGNSESLSEQSSRCSSQPPSPVSERKSSNGVIKMSNLKSVQSVDESLKKGRHVVIKTDCCEKSKYNITNSSSFVYEVKESNKTPLLYEFKASTSDQMGARPSSLNLKKSESKTDLSIRNRSKSIDNSLKKTKSENHDSTEKLHLLNDKILHSSPDLNEGLNDNENTPLFSQTSGFSIFKKTFKPILTNSNSIVSPSSLKNFAIECNKDSPGTSSEHNLPDVTNTGLSSSKFDIFNNQELKLKTRTQSESDNLCLLAKRSESNRNVHTSLSLGHISRQQALDLEDVSSDLL